MRTSAHINSGKADRNKPTDPTPPTIPRCPKEICLNARQHDCMCACVHMIARQHCARQIEAAARRKCKHASQGRVNVGSGKSFSTKCFQENSFQQDAFNNMFSTTCPQQNNFRITLFKHGVERVVVVPRCSGATLRPEASIQNKTKHNNFNSIQNKTKQHKLKRIQFKTERKKQSRQALETWAPEARLVESVDETDLYRRVTVQCVQLSCDSSKLHR